MDFLKTRKYIQILKRKYMSVIRCTKIILFIFNKNRKLVSRQISENISYNDFFKENITTLSSNTVRVV